MYGRAEAFRVMAAPQLGSGLPLPPLELAIVFEWLSVNPITKSNGVACANKRLNLFWRRHVRDALRWWLYHTQHNWMYQADNSRVVDGLLSLEVWPRPAEMPHEEDRFGPG